MDGDLFSELVSGINSRFHFFEIVCLEAGDVVVRARRTIHLDDVRTRGNLLAHNSENFGNAIGRPASRRSPASFVRC